LPPDVAVAIEGECQRLLDLLPKQAYRDVALMRFSGFTVREIAEQQGCHVTTIERQLQIIRKYWQKESDLLQSDPPHA
jgi:DNA-directed RNA polymerase specialized sigma24 family protein